MTSPRLPLDEAAAEHEWREQELAWREERAGEPGPVRGYRTLIRALRQPLPDALPPDFAARMERLAMAEHGTLDTTGRRFQYRLFVATAIFLAFALGGIAALYAKLWLAPTVTLAQSTGSHAPWLWALLSGMVFSTLADVWRRGGFIRR